MPMADAGQSPAEARRRGMLPPGTYKRGHRMRLPSEAAPIADAGRGHGPEGCGVIFTIQAGPHGPFAHSEKTENTAREGARRKPHDERKDSAHQ